MICGGSRTCGCSFRSDTLQIDNVGGLVTLETFGPGVVATKETVTSPFTWQQVFESTTGLSWVWDGSAWKLQSWIVEPVCELAMTAPFPLSSNSVDTVDYDVEIRDPFGWHAAGAPSRIVPNLPGVYEMWCGGIWSSDTDYFRVQNAALKNATIFTPQLADDGWVQNSAAATPVHWSVFQGIEINGTTDFLEHRTYQFNQSGNAGTVDPRCIVRWKGNL